MNCLESVSKYENKTHTLVYATDSCKSEVKEFLYDSDKMHIEPLRSFKADSGVAVDSIRSSAGFLAVLTHSPTKIDIIPLSSCLTTKYQKWSGLLILVEKKIKNRRDP